MYLIFQNNYCCVHFLKLDAATYNAFTRRLKIAMQILSQKRLNNLKEN